jgi:hypothetical protein
MVAAKLDPPASRPMTTMAAAMNATGVRAAESRRRENFMVLPSP